MPILDSKSLAAWSGGCWDPCPPDLITGVSNNTRTLSPSELYVSIRGEHFDGHRFVDDAFEKGAAAAMVAQDSELRGTVARPLLRVADTAEGLSKMATGYLREVSPVVVGVTGSVGKTTVKEMIATILAEAMPTARTRGNWNNDIGLPLSILAMEADARAGVFEVGMNHPGELEPLCEVLAPQWGVITTIGPVHIEFFDSVESIADEKAELLKALPADGHAVLCADDPYFDLLQKHVTCTLHTVSLSGAADWVVDHASSAGYLTIRETASGEALSRVAWPWAGSFNALNAAFAVAVARGFGLGWDVVRRGLERYQPLSMRWECSEANGVQIINDAYNANPVSMRAALSAFEESQVSGAKWLVLGDMLELGAHAKPEHIQLGALIASGAWGGLLVVGSLGAYIADGARSNGFENDRIWCCSGNAEVVSILKREMHLGDAVLLKASRGVALEEVVNGLKEAS